MARRIYVEALIRCDLDELWRRTQEPDVHQRWDLRFTRIERLAGADPGRFRYAVRPLPGLAVHGVGVSVGERFGPGGSRTSALRFRSEHPLSPIRSGSGYWRYVPTGAGVRFLTGYDYAPGWGRLVDLLFRPLMGWGTAWSFDRLRLWLEDGTPPEASLRRALSEAGIRAAACAAGWLAAPPVAAAALTVLAVALPPLPSTPAARRCLRRPPDPRSATAPATLRTLERP
ncbi:hypothetical protein [Pseudonocardia acaciae]|uniref:hypothetical protein n=1 Tax=Pseudonocardia acaciae TaxID=551276 RepID=UPI00048EDA6E|nr:hypothetical protein [Pseudonocardia acaciae]